MSCSQKEKNIFAVLINCTNQVIIRSSERMCTRRKGSTLMKGGGMLTGGRHQSGVHFLTASPRLQRRASSHKRSAPPSRYWNWKKKEKTVNRTETAEASWECVDVSWTVRRAPAATGVSAHLQRCKWHPFLILLPADKPESLNQGSLANVAEIIDLPEHRR